VAPTVVAEGCGPLTEGRMLWGRAAFLLSLPAGLPWCAPTTRCPTTGTIRSR